MARIPPKTIPLTLQWMYHIHDSHTHKETCPFLHNIQIFPRQTMNEPQVLQMWSKRGPGRGHQKNLVISWRERERGYWIAGSVLCLRESTVYQILAQTLSMFLSWFQCLLPAAQTEIWFLSHLYFLEKILTFSPSNHNSLSEMLHVFQGKRKRV